jgi:hypothetical protein
MKTQRKNKNQTGPARRPRSSPDRAFHRAPVAGRLKGGTMNVYIKSKSENEGCEEGDKMNKNYCTQNHGDCTTCSLVSYGRDCHNNAVACVADGRCQCGRPVIYCDVHDRNHVESYRARLAHSREMDTTPAPSAAEIAQFFGAQK